LSIARAVIIVLSSRAVIASEVINATDRLPEMG